MATPSTLLRVAAVASLALAVSPVADAAPGPIPPASAPAPANLPPAPVPYARLATAPAATPPPAVPPMAKRRREAVTPQMRAIRAANAAALSGPAPNAFVNAALIYDYEAGRLYRIDASPRFLTTIVLRPGEHLISKAAGDTIRWSVGETSQGAGDRAQVEVVLKPVRGGQRTNLVLTTDQRTYFLEAVSHDEPIYTSVISWNYPLDDMREAQAAAAQAKLLAETAAAAHAAPVVQANLPIDRLNFGYRIEHPKAKHAPPWEPSRVFDDGSKTYLQFPATMGSSAAPPLFLVGPGGQAELVNYRVKGDFYIVDRLIDVAELRLGEKPQTIVRITRTGSRG
ncbi:P-type conjugative transfer protein TrbG [Caulobacter sp. S45]|uniref:P-type conjugative transfer protein TrbG n=1 Tax=Caulobacter sp. S45 TaxID=1641861 RepID=UPI00131B419A|nr:P-type conjugative transfer protein TrbG [Caulobacter sp. S45]